MYMFFSDRMSIFKLKKNNVLTLVKLLYVTCWFKRRRYFMTLI